jgi:hypothetical protein
MIHHNLFPLEGDFILKKDNTFLVDLEFNSSHAKDSLTTLKLAFLIPIGKIFLKNLLISMANGLWQEEFVIVKNNVGILLDQEKP